MDEIFPDIDWVNGQIVKQDYQDQLDSDVIGICQLNCPNTSLHQKILVALNQNQLNIYDPTDFHFKYTISNQDFSELLWILQVDEKQFVTAHRCQLVIWSLPDFLQKGSYPLKGHECNVSVISLGNNLLVNLLTVYQRNYQLRTFDLKSQKYTFTWNLEHSGRITCIIYYRENQFISSGVDGCIKIWQLNNNASKYTFSFSEPIQEIVLLDKSKLLAGIKNDLCIISLDNGSMSKRIPVDGILINSIIVLKEDLIALACEQDNWLQIVDYKNEKIVKRVPNDYSLQKLCQLLGREILAGGENGTLILFYCQ